MKLQIMDSTFQEIVQRFPAMLQRLLDTNPKKRRNLGELPQKGIYVFYENKKALYVGRSDSMKNRILIHGRKSSQHSQAALAFLIAKEDCKDRKINTSLTRKALSSNPLFIPIFDKAKERVANMKIRHIEVSDPIEQHLFEVYAALCLETPYNDFNNH